MEVLVRLSTTREMLAESQASLESSRTVDSDTELLNQPFFDKQVEKLISFARRNLSDVALICIRVELSMPQKESWEGETDQRMKLVGRALAASIRLEDLGTRTDRFEFCVATPSSGLSGVLRFAARLRKVLENIEAAGPGVEVWTCIGLSTLSEELRRSAEELRALAQKRSVQAQQNRSRRIILGTSEGAAPGSIDPKPEDGSMDINLALALIRAGRAAEVVPHLPRLLEQVAPLLKLVRQQRNCSNRLTEDCMTTYKEYHAKSLRDPAGFWSEKARLIDWHQPFSQFSIIRSLRLRNGLSAGPRTSRITRSIDISPLAVINPH